MSQSLTQIYLHIIFSTKDRIPHLKDKPLRDTLYAYMAGICKNLESPALIIGGVEDHVHLLCRFSKKLAVADFLKELKRDSSKWIKTEAPSMAEFHWQAGYGAFSISPSHVDILKKYIDNQEAHHRTESFQDEFRRICRKYGVPIDERYVWD
jgi:REP element-mobilizing transposase RayT